MSTNDPGALTDIERIAMTSELLQLRQRIGDGSLGKQSKLSLLRAASRALELHLALGGSSTIADPVENIGKAKEAQAKKFFKDNLNGKTIPSVIGPVLINAASWEKWKFFIRTDDIKFRLVEHVREILEKGHPGKREALSKDRADDLVAFQMVYKDVRIDNLMVTAGLNVGIRADGLLAYNITSSGNVGWKPRNEDEALDSAQMKSGTAGLPWVKPGAEGAASSAPGYARIQPCPGVSLSDILDIGRKVPTLLDSATEQSVADDDLNIIIISVRELSPDEQRASEAPVPTPGPDVELTGKEFGDFPETPEGKKALRAAVKAFLEGIRGQMIDCPPLGAAVEMRQRGIKETLAFSGNPKKLKALHALPQLIAGATKAQRTENYKTDVKPGAEVYFYLEGTVTLDGESVPLHVVVERDQKGHLYYDLILDAPKEKAMLDSSTAPGLSEDPPDHYSGLPLNSQCSPDHNSGHWLEFSLEQENGAVMLDDASSPVLNLFFGPAPAEGSAETGAVQPAVAPETMATGIQVQKNGSVLVTGNAQLMADYVRRQMDAGAITQTPDGIVFKKSKAHLADFIPTSREVLPSGAVIYTHGNLDGGASIEVDGQASGVARNLANLKELMAEEWGPEKFRAVFGENAGADNVQAYQDEQAAIAQRKAAAIAEAAEQAETPQREAEEAAARKAVYDAEVAAAQAVREAEQRAEFDNTVGAGKTDNPVYQAYLDTLETLPTFEEGNSGFLGWAGIRAGEFERLGTGRPAVNREGWLKFVRDYANAHMAERLKEPETAPEQLPAPDYPLFSAPALFHGTALPFDHYTPSTRKGSGFDHQGQGFYLTTDKRGYAHFFALQAADRILNGPNEPKGEEARILESGGVILNVSLASGARVIDLTSPQASPELVAMVKNITDGNALRARVLADGYDGVAFVEPNHPEGFAVKAGAVTVVMYNADKAKIGGFEEAGKVAPLELDETAAAPGLPSGRAPAGGVVGMNGEHYKGGTFLPRTTLPKQGAAPGGKTSSGRGFLIEPGVFDQPPETGAKAILSTYQQFIGVDNGVASVTERPDVAIEHFVDPDVAEGRAFLRAAVDAYNDGMRWYLPGGIEVTDKHREVPAVPAPEIVEYTTKKGKVLRGIIRTDLTLEQAKAIDPYTWRMNGGYFIREKHLEGAPSVSYAQAAPAPVILTAEQQAEAAATAERQAAERRQQALANQVSKLRQVAEKAVAGGDEGLNRDRLTNTARRAGMAASSIAKAAADKAAGQTLSNLADAIENGAGGALASLTSRAQLEQLQKLMRSAQYESDKGLSYTEQQGRKGRPFDDNDLRHLVFPRPMGWSNWYRNAAVTLAKKSPTGNSRLIAALTKIGNGPERFVIDDEKDAITRKAYAALKAVKEGWDLATPMEMLAGRDRLVRMGITDGATLQTAVRELLPMMAEKVEEDPIKKAERAIIGQKVGIDFFPTPANVAQRMARLANIKQGTRVLEPSAGNGNLADAAAAAGGVVDVIEFSSQLRDILTAKGYNVVATDFDDFTPEQPYRAILMNPPWSQRRDAAHIMRAYGMLAAGGTLVAIAGEGVFFGKDAKAVEFRDWLDAHNATVESLEGGTFTDKTLLAQTGANGRLIVLEK